MHVSVRERERERERGGGGGGEREREGRMRVEESMSKRITANFQYLHTNYFEHVVDIFM